jgi:hypothetical protein
MGSFSIWHWLVVLIVLAVPAGVVWLVIRARRGSTGREQPGAFRDPTVLGKWTRWLVYGLLALSLAGLVSSMFERQMLEGFKNGLYETRIEMAAAADASDTRQSAIGVVRLITFVASGILVLMWIYRANANARRLGVSGMQFTPGWSVGWYFGNRGKTPGGPGYQAG